MQDVGRGGGAQYHVISLSCDREWIEDRGDQEIEMACQYWYTGCLRVDFRSCTISWNLFLLVLPGSVCCGSPCPLLQWCGTPCSSC